MWTLVEAPALPPHAARRRSTLLNGGRATTLRQNSTVQPTWTPLNVPIEKEQQHLPTRKHVKVRVPIGAGIAGRAAESGLLQNVQDASTAINSDAPGTAPQLTSKSILAIPLFTEHTGDMVLGVLQLCNKRNGRIFDDDDESLMRTFCAFAAMALRNSFEMETLRVGRDNSNLPSLPVHPLNRITVKGGWATVRRAFDTGRLFSCSLNQSRRRGGTFANDANNQRNSIAELDSTAALVVYNAVTPPQEDLFGADDSQRSCDSLASTDAHAAVAMSQSHRKSRTRPMFENCGVGAGSNNPPGTSRRSISGRRSTVSISTADALGLSHFFDFDIPTTDNTS